MALPATANGVLPAAYPDLAGAHQGWLSSLPCVDEQRCPGSNRHYGLLFWNNADGAMAGVPLGAYWSWGLGDSFILVIPSLDIVVARAGPRWGGRNVVAPFFTEVAAACSIFLPVPMSPVSEIMSTPG